MLDKVKKIDPQVAEAVEKELDRQRNKIELIASENFTSTAVLETCGTVLTNKYAEGYPNKRYYGGCEFVDIPEALAIERVKKIFGADHANVQPHAGAQANIAVYLAFLKPGDTVLGMDLTHGGHLTHGSPVNISGMYFNFVPYGVSRETEQIDYDNLRKIAKEHKPKMIVGGASAYPRIIDFKAMREICDEVGAVLFIDMAHIAGLIAAGLHPNPVPHSEVVSSTTHKTLRGPRGGFILCQEKYAKMINKAVFPGTQGGPLMHIIAAKAVAFKEAMTEEFKVYQKQIIVNAGVLANELMAGGFKLVSGGTDNHLILVDLRNIGLTGKVAEKALDEVGVTVNKNTVPFETQSPFITSGIRIGTPAITTRGMKEDEMKMIAGIISNVLKDIDNEQIKKEARGQVKELCKKYPLYEDLK